MYLTYLLAPRSIMILCIIMLQYYDSYIDHVAIDTSG